MKREKYRPAGSEYSIHHAGSEDSHPARSGRHKKDLPKGRSKKLNIGLDKIYELGDDL